MRALRTTMALALVAGATSAHAAGFSIDEQDAAATGRGGVAGARADASSAYYNPAGLVGVGDFSFELGATGIAPAATATTASGQNIQAPGAFYLPPYVYAAHSDGKLAFGIALNAPFGLGATWPSDYVDRYAVVSAAFQTVSVMGSLAYRPIEPLSIGASVGPMHTDFDLTRALDFVTNDGGVHIHAQGWGLGVILGVRYTVDDVAAFGLSGALPTPTSLSGYARFNDVPDAFGPMTNDQDMSTKVTLPARLRASASFHPTEPLRLDVEAEYTFWSSFKSLDIQFTDPRTPSSGVEKNWTDNFTGRLGAEYTVTGVATFRGGFIYDQNSIPADTLAPDDPDGDRILLTAGVGRQLWGGFRADLSYAYLQQLTRTSTCPDFPATYHAHGHLIGLSLTFQLPQSDAPRHAVETPDDSVAVR